MFATFTVHFNFYNQTNVCHRICEQYSVQPCPVPDLLSNQIYPVNISPFPAKHACLSLRHTEKKSQMCNYICRIKQSQFQTHTQGKHVSTSTHSSFFFCLSAS